MRQVIEEAVLYSISRSQRVHFKRWMFQGYIRDRLIESGDFTIRKPGKWAVSVKAAVKALGIRPSAYCVIDVSDKHTLVVLEVRKSPTFPGTRGKRYAEFNKWLEKELPNWSLQLWVCDLGGRHLRQLDFKTLCLKNKKNKKPRGKKPGRRRTV